jgi:hypothetical protein
MAATFDTLRAAKRLKDLGFSEAQAEGVAEMLREAREVDLSQLVTKSDLRAEIADVRADLVKWMFGIAAGQLGILIAVLKLFPVGHP